MTAARKKTEEKLEKTNSSFTTKKKPDKTKKKEFDISFYPDWCKSCGICVAFCPSGIIELGKNGKPKIDEPDKCKGCRFCEVHCPDFAITISERQPKRRSDDV